MASSSKAEQAAGFPLKVAYDPITGVPAEFNEYLPKDCEEFKKWKAAQTAQEAAAAAATDDAPTAQLQNLQLPAEQIEKRLPGGKVKKKARPEVVLERNTRQKKKCVTTVLGLDTFGVKLQDASKLFGKKFASGAAITKNPMEKDQIDVQGDFLDQAAELILKTYGKSNGIGKGNIFVIENKKKGLYFGDDDDDDEDDIIIG